MFKKAILVLCLLPAKALLSQEVAGIIIDRTTALPVEFATVSMTKKTDSTSVQYTITDTEGKFIFEYASPALYVMTVFFMGYEKKDTLIDLSAGITGVKLKVFLDPIATEINQVNITGEAEKMMKIEIDRKIYNVGLDIQSSSGSASDILRNIPSVEVSIDGELSLRGSTGVMILINGKVSPIMKGKSRAEALQQLPAGSIDRIEVINNPSAKYRPDGNVGIINIILKKNAKIGLNGSLTLNTGNNDRFSNDRHNGSFLISYKKNKFNIYGGFGMRQNRYNRYRNIDRNNLDSVQQTSEIYKEENVAHGNSLSENGNFGLDYELDSNNIFGISVNYFHYKMKSKNASARSWYDKNYLLDNHYEFSTDMVLDETEVETGLTYEHHFKKAEHTLEMEVNGTFQSEKENSYYSNSYFFPVLSNARNNILVDKTDNPLEVSIDYTYPFSEDVVLEAGYSGLFNQVDMTYRGEKLDSLSNTFFRDTSTSYRFKYGDMINALYATCEFAVGDFGIQPGLRIEQVNLKGKVSDKNVSFTNSYFNLYPSLHLSLDLDPAELLLSYSRRINRPDGDELNPYPEFDDPRNLYAGNSKLMPEYVHSFQFGMNLEKKKYSFVPSLYYSYTVNGFADVTQRINDSTLLTTIQNVNSEQAAGLELILTAKPFKFLSATLTNNIYYNQINASNLGYSSKRSIVTSNTSLVLNITIAKQSFLQLNSSFNSARITPQGTYSPYFVQNLGFKQNLFKNKFALSFTLTDVFKTLHQQMKLNTVNMNQISVTRRDSRYFYIGLTYKFGGVSKKAKEDSLQFDNTL